MSYMAHKKKLTRRIAVRADEEQYARIIAVQEDIALFSRGQKPEISDIIRAILGWSNPDLVSPEERAFLSGTGPLHGPHAKRNKP